MKDRVKDKTLKTPKRRPSRPPDVKRKPAKPGGKEDVSADFKAGKDL